MHGIVRSCLIALICGATIIISGCGTTGPSVRSGDTPTADLKFLEERAREFVATKVARDWDHLWELVSEDHRNLVVQIGRREAESSDDKARAQGFTGAEEVRGLSDREYFVRNRGHLADREMYVYHSGTTVSQVVIADPILVPFPQQRVRVWPVLITMSDGSSDHLAVTQDGRLFER